MSKRLDPLVGTWMGEGLAEYPTIDEVKYTERTSFIRDNDIRLFYEQVTWRPGGELLHHESGFIIDGENGLQMINAQGGGRVEVMSGSADSTGGPLVLEFKTTLFGNDPRMIAARRTITIDGVRLRYDQHMSIEAHKEEELHLSGALNKVGAG